MKPDFEYTAESIYLSLALNKPEDAEAKIALALRDAYDAGLERAAAIADAWQRQLEGQSNHAGCVAQSIRAERDDPDDQA
jgi:hypothetical protein